MSRPRAVPGIAESLAMKLFYSQSSPFVRKCLVAAHELNLGERLELVQAAAHPVNRDRSLVDRNPLGKIPTLLTDAGAALFDSRVICEYLNGLGDGHLLPAAGEARFATLTDQALADGLMDAAVLARYETALRPENLRWCDWVGGQMAKVGSALSDFERRAAEWEGRMDLGVIALGCALGYLDFRYADFGWRERSPALARWYEQFAARESMRKTRPPAA
jgi:glutathione S-transferase